MPYRPDVYEAPDMTVSAVSLARRPHPPQFLPQRANVEMNIEHADHLKDASGNTNAANGRAASTTALTPAAGRRRSLSRIEDHLMQEGGAPGIGSLAKEGPEGHGGE